MMAFLENKLLGKINNAIYLTLKDFFFFWYDVDCIGE
jgi:hypothetical protein